MFLPFSVAPWLLRFSDAGSLAECIDVCQHFPSCGSLALIQLRKRQLRPSVLAYWIAPRSCGEPWTRMREGISCDVRGIPNIVVLWGELGQKLFWISEKGPLSGAARRHADLLLSGSVPPLQRLCQEAVLRASWEVRGTTSGAHLPPSQVDLRPFKATSTTLKPACQERTYHPHKSTYDPSRPHLRPSNPHARSAPTTLTAQPTTL